jgi:AcrR family transcriptional regulator
MSKQRNLADTPAKAILEAAFVAFQRYGFRRTAMRDIAEIAGVSRPALYLHYANKADIFIAVAAKLRDDVLAAAEAAWPEGGAISLGLSSAFLAKELALYRLLHENEHGAEMRAVDQGLTAAIAADLEAGFTALVATRFRAAQKAGLIATRLSAREINAHAALVARLAAGLKNEAKSAAILEGDLKRLAEIVAAALGQLSCH